MEHMFTLFKLREGVSMEDYRKWSKEVDQKLVHVHPAYKSFEVYEVEGSDVGEDNETPFDVVESIVVKSRKDWEDAIKGEALKKVVEEWPRYADASTAVTFFVKKIPLE